jgi:hypothetical protein
VKQKAAPGGSRFITAFFMRKLAWLLVFLGSTSYSGGCPIHVHVSRLSGGTLTTARGINNHGDIVGAHPIVPPRDALLIKAGQLVPLAPNTVLGTNLSEAFKINDRGDVVGNFIGDDGFAHGFLLSAGVVTTLDFPGASDTYALGINDSGTVVGYWDVLDVNGNLLAKSRFHLDERRIYGSRFSGFRVQRANTSALMSPFLDPPPPSRMTSMRLAKSPASTSTPTAYSTHFS